MLGKLTDISRALRLVRPRNIANLAKRNEELRQEVRDLHTLVESLRERLDAVALAERQLRAIASADVQLESRAAQLDKILVPSSIAQHIASSVSQAPLHAEPFPHCVVDRLLPDAYYDALIKGLPPVELFADRPLNKRQLPVPFVIGPGYSRRVWRFMAETVAPEMILPAVIERFKEPLSEWLMRSFPSLGNDPLANVTLSCSDGRILLRGPGYRIPPHRDPKWGFITCLMYLVRPGDDERWGTQLYTVDADDEAKGPKPHWIDEGQCRLVKEIAFQRNRALIFLNSCGAHGAQIPQDAQPPDLERYAYQFRIGADSSTIGKLTADLPPDRRPLWYGKGGSTY